MNRLEIIEFLKGYAIFTIIIFHFLQVIGLPYPFNHLISFGGTGVHLFVLLSGLGLYLSHQKKALTFLPFIKKRVAKIYVPYIIIVLISALLSFMLPLFDQSLYALGGHLFLYKMFDESIIGSYGYPLWFISMILQFYFVFLVLAFCLEKLGDRLALILSVIISLSWAFVVIAMNKELLRVWNSCFIQYLWEFVLGMIIAKIIFKKNGDATIPIKSIYILIIGLVNCVIYAAFAFIGKDVGKVVNDIPALIGYSCLAIWIYQLNLKPINNFFLFTGKISFSVYLLHTLVFEIGLTLLPGIPSYITAFIALVLIYFLAVYYQRFIGGLLKIMKL